MADIKVGGEVDAFCTRCKMVLAHTTLAVWAGEIKRVRCNTCMGEHAYRSAKPSGSAAPKAPKAPKAPRASASPRAAARVEEAVSSYDALLAGKDRSSARRYNTKEHFEIGDLIEHPTFGLGVVAAVRLDKIDVAFRGGAKTLMHLKGEAPAVTLPSKSKKRDIIDLPAAKDEESDESEESDEDEEQDEGSDDFEDASEVDDE